MRHCEKTECKITELRKKKHMELPLLAVAQCVGNDGTRIQFKFSGVRKNKISSQESSVKTIDSQKKKKVKT